MVTDIAANRLNVSTRPSLVLPCARLMNECCSSTFPSKSSGRGGADMPCTARWRDSHELGGTGKVSEKLVAASTASTRIRSTSSLAERDDMSSLVPGG